MKDLKARLYTVDFKNKVVLAVSESAYTGSIVNPGFLGHSELEALLGDRPERTDRTARVDSSQTKSPNVPNRMGFRTDPSRYLETVVQKFEDYLIQGGCLDEEAYADQNVLADSMSAFQMLQRELPMLIDTMENLRLLIELETGDDPQAPNVKASLETW